MAQAPNPLSQPFLAQANMRRRWAAQANQRQSQLSGTAGPSSDASPFVDLSTQANPAPATGTKSKTARKQEKKAARKEEKRNKRAEKSARKVEKAEAEKSEETPSKMPVRRKLDIAMENAGSIESVLLLEREYKALQRDPSHRPTFYFLIDKIISNLRHIPRAVFGPAAGEEERAKLTKLREEQTASVRG